MKRIINFRKVLFLLALALICILNVNFKKPENVNAEERARVVLEFSDGTQKTWRTDNAKIKLGDKTLSYVYFGSFPQTEVTGKKLTKAIKNAKYNKKGVATVDGVKYKRISKEDVLSTKSNPSAIGYYNWTDKEYAYFRYEPIKWRVLSFIDGKAFLLSEYGIYCTGYNDEYKDVTWKESHLRKWLNDAFYTTAFSSANKKLIPTTKLTKKQNVNKYYDSKPGAATDDKVFVLTMSDVLNKKYGFTKKRDDACVARRCAATDYAVAYGAYSTMLHVTGDNLMTSSWWLRTPGYGNHVATSIGTNGSVSSYGEHVCDQLAIRPSIYLDLSDIIG